MLSYLQYFQNLFSNNLKFLLIATSLISAFTLLFTIYHLLFEFLQDMSINSKIG